MFTDLPDCDKASVKVPFVSKNYYLLTYGMGSSYFTETTEITAS